MSRIKILPLSESEIPTFIHIELAAFASHPRIPMLWPRGYTPDLHAYMARCKREDFHSSPNNIFIKAVDEATGEIVGVSQYTMRLDVDENEREEARGPMGEDAEPPGDWPEGGNWALKRFFARWSFWLPVESFKGRGYIREFWV